RSEAEGAVRTGQLNSYARFIGRYRGAIRICEARNASAKQLQPLKNRFTAEWIEARANDLRSNKVAAEELQRIANAIPTIPAYQAVRRRMATLPEAALSCLALLRRYEATLTALPPARVPTAIRQTLARESRLAWKERLERTHASLLL